MTNLKTLTTALAMAAMASAHPLTSLPWSNTTTQSSGPTIILPRTSIYNSLTSSVTYNTSYGLVSREPGTNGDTSTLFTFNIPPEYHTNKCELFFATSTTSPPSGSGGAQLFTSIRAAVSDSTSNYRGNELATLQTVQGRGDVRAVFTDLAGHSTDSLLRDCGGIIAYPSFELAPVGGSDYITWAPGDGLKVLVHLNSTGLN